MTIRIFITGGTFDKEYNELSGSLFFRESHVSEMLHLGRSRVEVTFTTLFMIDSLDMTDEQRIILAHSCAEAAEDMIVITHGTDTMEHTAGILSRRRFDKTIVLTDAMVPYKFGSSDGMFNLGSAIAFAQTLPYGVYIAMNGHFFPADCVTKNKDKGIFEGKTILR